MKYKVLYPFRDKTDHNKLYKKGDLYEHQDSERIKMLQERGFIEKNKGGKN